jgi:hypothetical protein
MRFVGRLIWVMLAAMLSAVVGLLVALTLGSEIATRAVSSTLPDGADPVVTAKAWLFLLDAASPLWTTIVTLTLVPAVLVLVVGEVGRIRALLYYLAGGGIAAAGVPAIMQFSQAAAQPAQASLLLVLATAGFAAGLAYWALAGRLA